MTLKSRIQKLRTKAGLDRCECEGQPLKTVVIYPGDAMPDSQACCPRCNRRLDLVINIVYEQPDPPAWFIDDFCKGVDTETAKQKWLEYVDGLADAAASPVVSDFSVAAGCVLSDGPPVSNVEGV